MNNILVTELILQAKVTNWLLIAILSVLLIRFFI
jgi:hypothetical protein